jgi:hypothetical protein
LIDWLVGRLVWGWAGLEVAPRNKAIAVDERMRTSDEAIFAVGDVACTPFVQPPRRAYLPLGGPANRMARIAADNMVGGLCTCGVGCVCVGGGIKWGWVVNMWAGLRGRCRGVVVEGQGGMLGCGMLGEQELVGGP